MDYGELSITQQNELNSLIEAMSNNFYRNHKQLLKENSFDYDDVYQESFLRLLEILKEDSISLPTGEKKKVSEINFDIFKRILVKALLYCYSNIKRKFAINKTILIKDKILTKNDIDSGNYPDKEEGDTIKIREIAKQVGEEISELLSNLKNPYIKTYLIPDIKDILNGKEFDILTRRAIYGENLSNIAEDYNVSHQAISSMYNRILKKIKKFFI